mmetsp:Transcript_30375/g.48912  ORF Transcript_30375/g.48912 Transcript_30375/m.48912 type:complete len:267 (-) Transcript_30375:436-1236(-)
MPTIQRVSHGLVAALVFEVVGISKEILNILAHLVSDGIRLLGQDLDWWTGNGLSILHVEAANLLQLPIVLAVVRQKLGHHSHWLQGIDGKAGTFPIEAAVTVPEGVDVAAIFVAKTLVALILVIVTTLNAFAHVLPWSVNLAWVRGIGSCHVVSLPNVHLGTAGAIVTKAHAVAEILWMWLPILRVGDAIDELDVMGALGITVTSSKFGTGLVVPQILSTIASHLHEVHGTVHATFHRGGIHLHRKLTVVQPEEFVVVIILEQEEP